MTSSDLVLSTLTVSSINGLAPGTGSGGGGGNVSVGTTVFSTLGVSSLNATSTITTSTMIATGNVGIGSNTPNAPLDVAGQIRTATTATNCIVAMTSGNGSFGSIESFNLGNTSKLPIALNAYGGNIGIGKTNPSQILDVAGAINCTSFLVNGTAVATGSGSVWGVNGSTTYYTSGSVGIGTIAPSQRLHVLGSGARIMAESNTGLDAVVQMKTNANTSYLFTDQNGNLQMYADTGKTVAFMNNNTVGIGNTNPNTFFCVGPNGGVNQSTNLPGISMTSVSGQNMHYSVGQGTAGTNSIFMAWAHNATAASAYGFISCYGGNNPIALQHGGGNVGIGLTNPSHRLHVNGAINCTSFLVNGVAVATGTGSVWGVNGSSAYYTSGNVGIGTAAPSSPFHIYALQSTVWPILINYSSGIQIVMGNGGSSTNFLMDTYNSITGGRPALCLNTSGGYVGIGTTAPAYPATVSNSGFINLEINRTAAGTNFGAGIVHSLTSSTGTFRGDYAYAFGGATTIATSAQTQAYGYYAIDLANAGIFGVNAGGLTSSYFFMTTSSACFPKTNVGIGTASPGNKLSVYSTTANDGIMFRNAFNSSTGSIALYTSSAAGNFIINGTADAGIVLPADGKDLFLGRTTTLYTSMVVKGGTGFVGIGTPTPLASLQITNSSAVGSGYGALLVDSPNTGSAGGCVTIRNSAGGANAFCSLMFEIDGTTSCQTGTTPLGFAAGNAMIYCQNVGGGSNAGKMGFIQWNGGAEVETMTILPSGNVGIGTVTPTAPLHIYSATAAYTNSLIINTAWPSVTLDGTGSTGRSWTILNGGSGAGIGVGNFGIFDITVGTYRLSIDSNGNVGIGNFTSVPTKLYVNAGGNVSNGILQFNAGAADLDSKTRLSGLANAGLMPSASGANIYLYTTSGTTLYRSIIPASGYFTGQHANQPIDPILKTNIQDYVGLIVSSADQGYYSINPITNEIITGSNAITITESLPYIELTTADQDPAVWGVLTNVKNDNLNTDGTTPLDNDEEWADRLGTMVRVNGLGEGALWVTNINGNIRNGDLICSSMIPGYGRKQNDDLFHSYTVAKATMSCNFDISTTKYRCKTITHDGTEYIAAFIGCSYHCS